MEKNLGYASCLLILVILWRKRSKQNWKYFRDTLSFFLFALAKNGYTKILTPTPPTMTTGAFSSNQIITGTVAESVVDLGPVVWNCKGEKENTELKIIS